MSNAGTAYTVNLEEISNCSNILHLASGHIFNQFRTNGSLSFDDFQYSKANALKQWIALK